MAVAVSRVKVVDAIGMPPCWRYRSPPSCSVTVAGEVFAGCVGVAGALLSRASADSLRWLGLVKDKVVAQSWV